MKHVEKLVSAIALLLISSGIAVAAEENINKDVQVLNLGKSCVKIERLDFRPFSNGKTELFFPTSSKGIIPKNRPSKLRLTRFDPDERNDSVNGCSGQQRGRPEIREIKGTLFL
ncbi:hypothetical protein [Dickeya dadantii]|uniref:hypothetical protein n=1 Tax=Dickeya dadantii TaxID=204038 RepID=UPI00131F010E|nr:hypothetical protein [Dickeya dadantii]